MYKICIQLETFIHDVNYIDNIGLTLKFKPKVKMNVVQMFNFNVQKCDYCV